MSKKRVLLLSGLLVAAILIGVAIAIFIRANAVRKVSGLDNPYVVFNFNPQKLEKISDVDRTKSMYSYDLSTGEIPLILPHESIWYSDLNSDTGMLIGRNGGQVVEVSMTEGVLRNLGPGVYGGEPLVDSTIRWRPNSRDYSALTESGMLVLYRQETESYEFLADMSAIWNGYAFGGSWANDGKTLCVPDESGIALLDVSSKRMEHWVTLPITYCTGFTSEAHNNRIAFDVSKDKTLIVYCEEDALKMVAVDTLGIMGEPVTLEEYAGYDRAFAISPDGDTVAFAVKRRKRTLFTPAYVAVSISHNGIITKLFETSPLPKQRMIVLW